jgi:WhiB family redox-sensing transcriptional regulator
VTRHDLSWQADAACRGYDTEIFFRSGAPSWRALSLCRSCPVIADCYRYVEAIEKPGYRFGLWAGLTPHERRHYAKLREQADEREQ